MPPWRAISRPSLSSLIRDRALQAFADEHDLIVSKRLVDAEIVKLPGTRGLDGKFSDAAYQSFLQQQRLTDQEVRELLATGLATRLLLAPAAANARIPVGVATPYASMLLEAREAEIAIVPAELFAAGIPQPSDADIQAYYKQNGSRYMVPEQRVLSIARIGPEQVANVAATEQEIAAYYKANQALYGGKDIRSLTQVIVQSEAEARALAQRARAGAGPRARRRDPGRQDPRADRRHQREASPPPPSRPRKAPSSARSGPTLAGTSSRWTRSPARPATPLSAVRGEIAARLTAEKRKEALTDLVTRIEDRIADGASFAEAIKGTGVTALRTPPITAGGIARSQPGFKLPAELAAAVRAGFELGEGDEPVVETLPGEAGYALGRSRGHHRRGPGPARLDPRPGRGRLASQAGPRPRPGSRQRHRRQGRQGQHHAGGRGRCRCPPAAAGKGRQAPHRTVPVPGQCPAGHGHDVQPGGRPQPDGRRPAGPRLHHRQGDEDHPRQCLAAARPDLPHAKRVPAGGGQ